MTEHMQLSVVPEVRTGMGIHRPPGEVFAAFVDPAVTTRFWIADSSGPLGPAATVTWDFNTDGARASIFVDRYEPGARLVFDWGDADHRRTVDFRFTTWRGTGCYVEVSETGFRGDGDQLAAQAADATGGFTMVLCALKALLEHDIELGVVADRLPEKPG